MVPNMTSMKQKRIMMSTIIGKLFKMVETNELIPGIELIVLRGRRIRITLIAEMSYSESPRLTQPRTTTRKSNCYEKKSRLNNKKGVVYFNYEKPRNIQTWNS